MYNQNFSAVPPPAQLQNMKNAFSINIIFLLLTIVGLALVPKLPVQLQPDNTGERVHVSYQWHGMGPEVIEKEVTSPIEGTLSSMRGLKQITSNSYSNRGEVTLVFKDGTDMDAARFEVMSLMRGLHSQLPDGVNLPRVSYKRGNDDDNPLLMVYTINGEGSSYSLQQYAERYIAPGISNLPEISNVSVTGASPMEWEITYRKEHLRQAGLDVRALQTAIRDHLNVREIGNATVHKGTNKELINLTYSAKPGDSLIWNEVVVGKQDNRVLRLTDVAKPELRESEPRSYFRVNGLNTVYLVINSAKGANQVDLATRVRQEIERQKASFPANFSMLVNYDASKEISREVEKITSRALLAIIILLVFVLLVSRNLRYLLIVGLSLVANLCIAVIFYYILGIEIHIYSLAGITVSLGMIIDNTIVMTDHLRHSNNRKAFLAILAATLTTMGALVVIFFLKEEQQLNLLDFAVVMIVNLSVSLAIALWLVPSLLDRLPLGTSTGRRFLRRKRRVVRVTRGYARFLNFGLRWRRAFIVIFIWGFGLPVFLLPDKLETDKDEELVWYQKAYNTTLGNNSYTSVVKPWVNRILGGSWYYFSNYFSSGNFNWDSNRTKLYMRGSMPDGSSIHQMNNVFKGIENYLTNFEEIELFTSRIYSIENASLEITFTDEAENSSFPHVLKNRLINKANQIGSSDFVIYGVGRGFSNATHDGMRNNRIELRGYNYDLILDEAGVFSDSLLKNPRIQEVIIQTGSSWRGKPRYGFVMGLNPARLQEVGSSLRNVYQNLQYQAPNDVKAAYIAGKDGTVAVTLSEANQGKTSVWDMQNNLLYSGESGFRLKDVGYLTKERTGDVIRKQNQEYVLMVEYDFIGPYELNRRVRERSLEQLNEELPIGFSAVSKSGWGGWNQKDKTQYWLLLIVAAVIFLLCSVLFESLRQPLVVISAIPVSFIGLFLTFALFKINFDQGGYAAMILLCGLTVNAALYIINDYNNMRKRNQNQSNFKLYLKAFNHKIIPIALTTLSTIMGLLPFLLACSDEAYCFSLASGATGGLVFSIIAVVVWLPLTMFKNRS
jgi:multidrug efflux pump subunit AcrB